MSTISVIIPIYNAEQYLRQCIESVLKQSFADFELLLVDDGSSDASGAICDEYAAQDSRIRVFHKQNGGVSSARNLGLDQAVGDWIAFIDADDWVEKDYLSHLYGHTNNHFQLVVSYATIYAAGKYKKENYPALEINNYNFDFLLTHCDLAWHTAPWSKLYKREIIEFYHLRFCEDIHLGEDAVFLYNYMVYIEDIYTTNDTDYIYFYDNCNSLTKRINSVASEIIASQQISAVIDRLIVTKHLTNQDAISKLYWLKACYVRRILNAIYDHATPKRERISIIHNIDIRLYTKYIHDDSLKGQILITLLRFNLFGLYDWIRIIVKSYKQ